MKNDSDGLSLSFAEFCHIRNVITRAELETLMFDEKLYNEVAQSKVNSIDFDFRFEKCFDVFSCVLHVEKFILIF